MRSGDKSSLGLGVDRLRWMVFAGWIVFPGWSSRAFALNNFLGERTLLPGEPEIFVCVVLILVCIDAT